jgi:hypothetical protein
MQGNPSVQKEITEGICGEKDTRWNLLVEEEYAHGSIDGWRRGLVGERRNKRIEPVPWHFAVLANMPERCYGFFRRFLRGQETFLHSEVRCHAPIHGPISFLFIARLIFT